MIRGLSLHRLDGNCIGVDTLPRLIVLLILLGTCHLALAENPAHVTQPVQTPSIALIIDDLGNQRKPGKQAIALPGPVACAFLPQGHFTQQLARAAHAGGKEVMLHLPMQAAGHESHEPGELRLDMTRDQFIHALHRNLEAVPHVSGLNNHRGSLLTRHPGHMAWLMRGLNQFSELFFVDSRTTAFTVAHQLAVEYGVPTVSRSVFLDNSSEKDDVRLQFSRLLDIARREGTALGIGHPYPGTLAVLTEEIARLDEQQVRLVPVARLIELEAQRASLWHASLSR